MKVFVSLISLSSQNTVSRKERQAETVTEISPLFTENIDLFLESSSTDSWLDDLAVFDTTPDFSLLGEVFDTTTGVFSFIIPTTAPAFEIPSTTQSSAELVNFTTDIGKLLLENTPWPELQTTTESRVRHRERNETLRHRRRRSGAGASQSCPDHSELPG